jgi:7-cyano-7-deazaguanine synthase
MNNKAVVIASGGIDSSTLLFKTVNENYETYALTFIYGQKHKKEIDCAKWICEHLEVSHKILDISVLKEILSGSALTDSSIAIPEVPADVSHYDTLKATIVPNRNSIFLSIAIGYAVSTGGNRVFFGAHHSDRGIYPDCRPEFVEAFESAERLATDNPDLIVDAPFAHMDKSDIVRLGTELGVPYQKTWSCYRGDELHCGVCSSCRERKRAFTQSGVPDPIHYER